MSLSHELIDAIKQQYSDDSQLQIEILQELMQNKIDTKYVKLAFEGVCAENHICPVCLSKMEVREYKEPRPYQEGITYELMSVLICRNCGYEL